MKLKSLSTLFIIIIVSISLFTARPFFQRGYFETHDGGWAVVRLAEMEREIKDLQFPPRYSDFLNHGYGYPLFNFTYPSPYYLGIFIRLFHIGYIATIKLLFIGSILGAGIGMYVLGKFLTNSWGGLLGSLFYVGNFYRIINLYVRGSLGESMASAVFPFVILFTILYCEKKKKRYLFFSSLLICLLLTVHNVSALFFLPVLLIILYLQKNKFNALQILLFGFGLSAFFILPAIAEKSFISFAVRDAAGILFSPSWDYQLPFFQLGIYAIISVVSGYLIYKFGLKPKDKNIAEKSLYTKSFLYFLLLFVWFIFMMTPQSEKLWNLPLLSSIDFPWRLLGPISFLTAYLSIMLSVNKKMRIFGLILACASLVNTFPIIKANINPQLTDEFFVTNDATTTSADELMPKWVADKPKNRYQDKIVFLEGQGLVNNLSYNSKMISAILESPQVSKIMINTIYYPGWILELNGKTVSPILDKNRGTMIVVLDSGTNKLKGYFSETPLRAIADIISLVSLAVLGILCIRKTKHA